MRDKRPEKRGSAWAGDNGIQDRKAPEPAERPVHFNKLRPSRQKHLRFMPLRAMERIGKERSSQ